MFRGHKRKVLIMLVTAAVLILYVRTVPQISLNERAIVVGFGIDYKDGQYQVSTQIINPSSASQTGSSNDSFGVLTGYGKTLTEAIVQISLKTGLKISLSQCNVVILGNGVPYGSEFPSINYLVQNYQIPEQALLLATENNAVDLLRCTPVLTSISAFQLQQTFNMTEDNADVMHTVIKNFISGYISKSGVSPIAYVSAKELPENTVGGEEASSGGSQKLYEFNYDKTLLLSNGKQSLLLDKESTVAVNLLTRSLKKGNLEVEVDGCRFSLQLVKSRYTDKCKLENGRLSYKGALKLQFNIAEVSDMQKFGSLDDVGDNYLQLLNEEVAKVTSTIILDTYEKCKIGGYDVYMLYNKAYSAEGVKWKEVAGGDYLDLVDFNVGVKAEVTRK